MPLTLVTAPATEPVTLAEAKAHLRVDVADDDTLIAALIVAAREHAERFTHRALITQTWDWSVDGFPAIIVLPKPRLVSVTSITYMDSVGNSQTLAVSNYTVDGKSEPGRIVPAFGNQWPVTQGVINAVTVRFVAGYGDASAVPQGIKQAMLLMVGHWYDHREAVAHAQTVVEVPMAVDMLLMGHRVWSF